MKTSLRRRHRTNSPAIAALCLAALASTSIARGQYTYITSFGGAGSGTGQLRGPADVAVNAATGQVYVADTGNNRIDVFDSNGGNPTSFGAGNTTGRS